MSDIRNVDDLSLIESESLGPIPSDSSLYDQEVLSLEADRSSPSKSLEDFEANLRACELRQVEQIIEARKTYADKVFSLVRIWLIVVGSILIGQGFNRYVGFELSDKVLITLIGGTTLNVIGIFTIVANFLFPKNGHSPHSLLQNKAKSKTKPKTKAKNED
ncbi:hypothetical protein [Undibacterium sp. RuTC16W]|uniref:hypothetical protein n=1 Tax=Undibacterium sp. RuTC16W TaxID=3413048 RepID=UPI003BEFAD54